MKVRYVTAIQNLEITGDLARGDKLGNTLFITNDKAVIRRLVEQRYNDLIGGLEWAAIQEAPVVIYSNDQLGEEESPEEFLRQRLYDTQGFFHALWLHTDNSVDNELGFLFYDRSSGPMVSSNFIAVGLSRADGKLSITKLTREELRAVRECYRNLSFQYPSSEYVTQLAKGPDRAERALYQIQVSRTTHDLAVKILHYCSALETLFASASQGELSHQLSERLACFLEEPGARRIATYRQFKRAYSIRSRITHGAAIADREFPQLVELSVACDEYVRRSVRKLLNDGELRQTFQSPERLDEYFLGLILGAKA